jgi:nucleoside-diphosphate-sugar epimerase
LGEHHVSCSGRILVTGAYGLIGHESVLQLGAAQVDVVATDILPVRPADAAFDALPLAVAGVAPLAQFMADHGIGAVVHASGISGPMLGRDRPHDVLAINVGGTLDLYEAARQASVTRIVLLSSASAYGAADLPSVNEATPLGATDVYGVSKAAGEFIARAYATHGIETVVLRPSWVYGLRRRTPCVIRTMVADALAGRMTRFGYGRGFPRQFVHVSDVATAVVAALQSDGSAGPAFNLADGRRYVLDEVAALVARLLPKAQIEMAEGPDPDDVLCGLLDIQAAAERLSWYPQLDLEAGIERLAAELSELPTSDRHP